MTRNSLIRNSMIRNSTLSLLTLLLSFLIDTPVIADTQLNQELKFQAGYAVTDSGSLLDTLGVDHYSQSLANYRFRFDWQQGNWAFDFDYALSAEYQSELDKTQLLSFEQNEPSNWFDWSNLIHQDDSRRYQHSIERANLVYTNEQWTFKLGRQAITWGNGILFHPMDLFNPFSPAAIDTSYKPGVDMLYAQRLFDSGADLQMLWVPRKARNTNDFVELQAEDSFAAKSLFYVGALQVDLMLAEDYGDKAAAVGLVGPIDDAIWKLDLAVNEFDSENVVSLDFNLQYSWNWGEKPVSGFLEFYRNGFAPDEVESIASVKPELLERFGRGQLFTLGKDQLAMGLQIQWTPLWTVSPSVIYQVNDQSRLLIVNANYSSGENSALILGAQIASGEKGSQYGGLYLTPLEFVTLAPDDLVYLRYESYF